MTEMWERFSYYSMLALLVLYMVKYLFEPTQVESVFGYAAVKDALEFLFGPLSTQALASHIYGLYTGLLFLTPLIGGLLADRVLGQRATVVVGAIMMSIGQFMLVFESLFFLGLLTLILGNGAFKPNTLTQVGALYAPGDARRDRAFLIVLVGGNVGAFFAPLVSGALAQALGWRYGFASAGVGMLIALVVYLAALPTLPIDELHKAKAAGVKKKPLGPNERRAVLALIMLFLAVTLFWAIYEQQGNTLVLWSADQTDRTINLLFWSGEIPLTFLMALNGLMSFVLLLLVIQLWSWQGNGELYVWPTGLSLVSQVAPARVVSLMMGLWLATGWTGNLMGGWLGGFWSNMHHANFFFLMAALATAAGVVAALLIRPLKSIVDRPAIG